MTLGMMKAVVFVVGGSLIGMAAVVSGQQPLFKRTILQQSDLSVPGREAITAVVEFQPGGSPGRHTHFGEEVGYVIEGSLTLDVEGKPPIVLKAGQAFLIPNGTVHNATAGSDGITRIVATYVVEKGKPLATPVAPK